MWVGFVVVVVAFACLLLLFVGCLLLFFECVFFGVGYWTVAFVAKLSFAISLCLSFSFVWTVICKFLQFFDVENVRAGGGGGFLGGSGGKIRTLFE